MAPYVLDLTRGTHSLSIPLTAEAVNIGRTQTGGLFNDRYLSLRHARLFLDHDGRPCVEDLKSQNGTFVNGESVTGPMLVRVGDELSLGSIRGAVRILDEAQTAVLPVVRTRTVTQAAGSAATQTPASSTDELMRKARALFDQKQFEPSRVAFAAAAAADPGEVGGHYGIGMCFLKTNRLDQAEDAFRRALAVNPHHADSLFQLGIIAEKAKSWDAAINAYSQAARIQPGHPAERRLEQLKNWLSHQRATTHTPKGTAGPAAPIATFAETLGREVSAGESDSGELILSARRRVSSYGIHWLFAALFLIAAGFATAIPTLAGNAASADSSLDRAQVRHDSDLLAEILVPVCVALAIAMVLWVFVLSTHSRALIYKHRVDVSTGVFFQSRSSVWLYDVSDIDYERGPLLILTNTGCIALQIGSEQVGPNLRHPQDESKSRARNTVRLVGIAPHRQMRDLWHVLRDQGIRDRRSVKQTLL